MAKTNNGWTAVGEDAVVRLYLADDADGATVLKGDVATAFTWLVNQIHARVERVTKVNGHRTPAYNKQVGGDPGSNHVSGTALDINGHLHPYEHLLPPAERYANYRSGWSDAEQAEIRKILREAGGLFSWGLDYGSGWRDAMHFDITRGKTAADVRRFVEDVRKADIMATLDDEDLGKILEVVKNGLAQALVEGLKPKVGDAGVRGRNIRDALHGIVGSSVTVNTTAENVAWLRYHGQAGLAELVRKQGATVASLREKIVEHVVAELPSDGQGLTVDQVKDALRDVLRRGVDA